MFKVNLVRGSWKVMSWILMFSMVIPTVAVGDLSIAYAAPTALYQNDFESGIGSWTGTSGTVDTNNAIGFVRSCPGDFSACSGGDNDYLRFNNDTSVIKSITTTGYQDITLKYWRYAYSLEGNDRIKVSWRVGTTTSWSSLESTVGSASWVSKSFVLTGSGNQSTIQFKLELNNAENDDYALFDDVQVLAEEQPAPDGISILNINGDTQPFDYSCPNNPPANPVTITGSGAGSAPPGQIEQYAVQLDWGDGNQTNGLGSFTPNSGQGNFTFTFSAGPHEYATSGNFIITARLYHSQPPGQDNQADAVATISICITIPEVPAPTYCGDGIVQNPNDDQVIEECDGQAGVGLHQSCDQGCQLVDLTYCGDDIKQTPNTEATGGPLNDGYESCDGTDGVGAHQVCSETCVLTSLSYCGDGQVQDPNDEQGTEQCDGQAGVGPHQSCDESCQLVNQTYCGDGQIQNPNDEQVAEECDDGPDGSPTCTAECTSITVSSCDPEQELVVNGGFEQPSLALLSEIWDIFDSSQTSWTTEWTTTTPSVFGSLVRPVVGLLELQRGIAFGSTPAAGDQYAELDSDWAGPSNPTSGEPGSVKIYQDVPTTPGQAYKIKFAFSPRPSTNAANNQLAFSWDSILRDTISEDGSSNTNTAWVNKEYVFIASSNVTRLEFADVGVPSDSLGTFLDTVSVRCTDETIPAVCGNGVKEGDEQCDDHNLVDGDGCSANCTLETLTCEGIHQPGNGWYGRYYNYYATHPDMNLQDIYWPDAGHGDPLGTWDTDWYENEYFRFSRVDSSLTFGEDFFPFDIAPESAGPDDIFNGHDFHFGVHWSGVAKVTTAGQYTFELVSDDDAWVYVDGVLIMANPGIHAPASTSTIVTLTGANVVDVYFAERHTERSHFSFNWVTEGVTVDPYNSDCPECGNYITEEGNQEECDAGPNGSETCSVECTNIIPEFCGDGVKTESEQCDDSNNVDGDGCSANCSLEQLTCEDVTDEDSGWFARYYNYYATHPDMNLQMGVYWPDDGHGDPLGSWDTDWYDNQYFRFSRVDSSLTFGDDFFPFDIAPESAGPDDIWNGHDFHFGVHWSAIATVNTPGVYNVELASDDDAWVYVDGVLQADAPGIHAVETEIVALTLTGYNVIDIYYAERHVEEASFSFTWLSDGVELTPYNSDCPECGNYITEESGQEECDAGPNGSESCTVECTSLITTNICGYKWNDRDGNQSRDEEPGLPDWTIQLLQFSSCEPGDEWADAVTSFSQGNRKNGTDVLVERSDTSKALGAAQNNDTINFLSLGFGGEVVLQFDNIIVNGVGDDLQIVETSYGSPSCASYPETAHVYASKDGVSWTDLGTGCLDETYDLGSLPWAQYVKIVDISNVLSSNFPAEADGFDIDAVKALNCAGGWDIIASTTTDEEGNYCFEDLQPGDYRVQEQMQQGWVNTTSLFEDLTLAENEHATVNFGNKTSYEIDEGSICGYKFNDLNHNGTFDEGEEGIPEWHIFATGNANTDTWTNGSGRYCFNGLTEGVWSIFEELVSGWATSTAATSTVNFSGTGIDNINFGNFMCVDSDEDGYNVGGGLCGQVDCNDQNGSINPGEAEVCNEVDDNCDGQIDEDNVCNEEPPIIVTTSISGGGGGGGGNPQFLSIHTESSLNSCEPTVSVTVSWFTNQASDSRVVYDTVSHNVVGGAPNYGYANSTGTTDDGAGVTFHTVVIGGLSANTTYYFRAVSEKSNVEVYGSEMSTNIICDEGTPPQGPSTGPTGPGIVAGVETGPENNEGGTGGGNDSGSQGQVQGVEFAEAAENGATSTPTLPAGGEQGDGSATTDDEATPMNCVVYLWILIVLNALAMAYLKMKGNDAKNFWLHNGWWILALIAVLALIIWYAACWLVVLLIATLVVAIVTPFVIKEQE